MKKILAILTILLSFNAFAYDFNYQGKNLNYNPDELKFYKNNELLTTSEVQNIFPDREIVLISKFSENKKIIVKNSIFKSKKIVLLNDTQRTFHRFFIYPEASRYEDKNIKSLITIHGRKNVRLKHEGGDEFEIVVH